MAAIKREVVIYDRRSGDSPGKHFDITYIQTLFDFRLKLSQAFGLYPHDPFVICTTNREEVNSNETFGRLEHGDTLYVLSHIDQELPAQTLQKVDYLPHYDTLVKSGMYEYYASEGQNPLPYAFAELIDNSLAATVNSDSRKIELRLNLDDTSAEKSVIFVIDNGCGMTSWQLNDWAVYRLSKFTRRSKTLKAELETPPKPKCHLPRSLNSEISYFGAGGKQAIFFIGHATRMITKPKYSKDVHELCISKEDFEKKEKNREFVYSGVIRNRKPGDSSHISAEDEIVKKIIEEEVGKDSFTCVAIWGITPEHVAYLKYNYQNWCSQLAHIYHYYLHGPHGNIQDQRPKLNKILDIEVKLYQRGILSKMTNLRDINDDLQSKFIRTASSTYDFKCTVDGTKIIEGILRYHPFLYDHETYPKDQIVMRGNPDPEEDHDYFHNDTRPGRGRRPIFECFWNGRLIPYTSVDEFDWCSTPKKARNIPLECYNRVSGVLWTSDDFQVSTNKLTFMDLENKLRDKNTVFTRILNGMEKRANIDKQFTEWLQNCHELCDKQVMFTGFQGLISRPDLQKHKQYPWAVYESIEWDGKIFKKGQLVRTQRTVPVISGTIRCFYLYGDHSGEVCATGGDFEMQQEPRTLYGEIKTLPLAKLDRRVTEKMLSKYIEEEEDKLPDKLIVTWPEGDELKSNEKRPAGKTIGDIKVEIANRREELISKLPGSSQKKLLVELKIIWHSPSGDVIVTQYQCQHAKTWPYWFRKMENVKNLGPHTLSLQATLTEGETVLCSGKELPSFKIRFTVTEAEPEKFTVGILDGPFRVGNPFQIPLEFQDKFGNPTKPNGDFEPTLKALGLDLSYECVLVKGNSLIIKGIIAKGSVETSSGKNFTLTVKIPGLDEDTQSLKIRLLPGLPHTLKVLPDDEMNEIENGTPAIFDVSTVDMAGNSTCEPRLTVQCKFQSPSNVSLPSYTADLSNSGRNTITGLPLSLKNMNGPETITATFEVLNHKDIVFVQRQLILKPSQRASTLQVTCNGQSIEREKEFIWIAGDTITGLEIEILDEGGRKLEITPHIASKLKVTWTNQISRNLFLEGKLPDIETPQSVKQQLYCQVSLSYGSVIDFGFTVKPKHGDAAAVKATCSGSNKLRIGECLPSHILVNVTDKYGNPVKKLVFKSLAELSIISEGLDYTPLEKALGQTTGFVISGLKFSDGKLGSREVCISWRDLKDYIRLEMTAGPPAKIVYPNYPTPDQMVTLYNETKLPKPFSVQLLDSAENPCTESNIKIQIGFDEGLKTSQGTVCAKTNNEGKADFGNLLISVRANQVPGDCPNNICTYSCRGIFSIMTKAFCGRNTIMGPLLKLHIPCDPGKPVEVNVKYDSTTNSFCAGEELPNYTVSVIAEDGGVLRSVKPSQIIMHLWKSEGLNTKVPKMSTKHSPAPTTKDPGGIFNFKNLKVPQTAGSYNIQFDYDVGKKTLSSSTMSIKITPGKPTKLAPAHNPGVPTVSNTHQISNRVLVEYLKFEIKDDYGNLAGLTLNGTLTLLITSSTPDVNEYPRLTGNVTSVSLPISKGQAVIENIIIQENCPGLDGKEYMLRCTPHIPSLSKEDQIPPYEITFLFYNDAHKQAEMANLSKERDRYLESIKMSEEFVQSKRQHSRQLQESLNEAEREELQIRAELRRSGYVAYNVTTLNQVKAAIERSSQTRQKLEKTKRRECTIPPAPDEPDVLGKVGHLAGIEDDDVAKVLSWHMQSDIDCIITQNMAKAREIYRKTNGQQQVLALDSIFKKNLPDWNRPLPHCRIRGYNPSGNPVFARDLLHFTKDPESCKIIFGLLLSDTIILDTLDHATQYREQVVKQTNCPTLLTRNGERIRNNGKFGGAQNKAPPVEKLRGMVFGAPLPKEFNQLNKHITLLQNLQQAMEHHQEKKKLYMDSQRQENSPLMVEKQKELEESKKRLSDVEVKLGMTPARGLTTSSGRMSTRGVGLNMPPELQKISPRRAQNANNSLSDSSLRRRLITEDNVTDHKNQNQSFREDSPRNINGISTRGQSPRDSVATGRRKAESAASGSGNKRRRKS